MTAHTYINTRFREVTPVDGARLMHPSLWPGDALDELGEDGLLSAIESQSEDREEESAKKAAKQDSKIAALKMSIKNVIGKRVEWTVGDIAAKLGADVDMAKMCVDALVAEGHVKHKCTICDVPIYAKGKGVPPKPRESTIGLSNNTRLKMAKARRKKLLGKIKGQMTVAQIAAASGESTSYVDQAMERLKDENLVVLVSANGADGPKKWRRA